MPNARSGFRSRRVSQTVYPAGKGQPDQGILTPENLHQTRGKGTHNIYGVARGDTLPSGQEAVAFETVADATPLNSCNPLCRFHSFKTKGEDDIRPPRAHACAQHGDAARRRHGAAQDVVVSEFHTRSCAVSASQSDSLTPPPRAVPILTPAPSPGGKFWHGSCTMRSASGAQRRRLLWSLAWSARKTVALKDVSLYNGC